MSNVTVKDMGWNKIQQQLKLSDKSFVQVGFYDGAAHKGTSGQTIAQVAARNEYGEGKIPSRPFMRQAFEKNVDRLKQMKTKLLKGVYAGTITVEKGLSKLGAQHEGDVKKEIGSGDFVKNSPVTIARKGSSMPLIDTGQMRQSVAHIVKMKGGI